MMLALLLAASQSAPVQRLPLPQLMTSQQQSGYRLSGDRDIWPARVWEDGRKTYIDWPPSVEIPAVFIIDDKRNEAAPNGHFRAGVYVIDAVHSRLIFRLDKRVARAERK